MQPDKINLFYKDGGSDKVYQAQLEEKDGGWIVNFQYGKRGSALKAGTKTASPVEFEAAKKIYDSLVNEKCRKGYTTDTTGVVFSGNTDAKFTGIVPQLLNPISAEDAEMYINDPGWIAEEKYDGENRLVHKHTYDLEAPLIDGINRKGQTVALRSEFEQAVAALNCDSCILAGEDLGDEGLMLFDVLEIDGVDLRKETVDIRWTKLMELVAGKANLKDGYGDGYSEGCLKVADIAVGVEAKRRLLNDLKTAKREGIVFKKKDSAYIPGRPASGGSQLKFKFVENASCLVASQTKGKRSVGLMLLNADGNWEDVGKVTIPVNKDIPAEGSILDVKYLYAYKGGSLYQPVYDRVRTDIDITACTTAQIKYKPASRMAKDLEESEELSLQN